MSTQVAHSLTTKLRPSPGLGPALGLLMISWHKIRQPHNRLKDAIKVFTLTIDMNMERNHRICILELDGLL